MASQPERISAYAQAVRTRSTRHEESRSSAKALLDRAKETCSGGARPPGAPSIIQACKRVRLARRSSPTRTVPWQAPTAGRINSQSLVTSAATPQGKKRSAAVVEDPAAAPSPAPAAGPLDTAALHPLQLDPAVPWQAHFNAELGMRNSSRASLPRLLSAGRDPDVAGGRASTRLPDGGETENPKPEIRNPKQIRMPKFEGTTLGRAGRSFAHRARVFRPSDFELLSGFLIRVSEFSRFVLLAMHQTLVERGFPSPQGERR